MKYMITSKLTGKTYDQSEAVYFSNPKQHLAYLQYFKSFEYVLDELYTSEKRPDALVFVWKKCPETAKAKELWDRHEL